MVVDCHHSLGLCGDRMKMSLLIFFRETPTSPWVPFRAKFRPLGRLFRPSRPFTYSLICGGVTSYNFKKNIVFLFLKLYLVIANSADPDVMLHYKCSISSGSAMFFIKVKVPV